LTFKLINVENVIKTKKTFVNLNKKTLAIIFSVWFHAFFSVMLTKTQVIRSVCIDFAWH